MQDIHGMPLAQSLEDVCHPQRMALIVYDMQVGILRQIKNGANLVRRVLQVVNAARQAGLRIIFMRHLSLPPKL